MAIKIEAKERNLLINIIQKEAVEILTKMAHNFQMRSVRPIGYVLLKVIRVSFLIKL